MAIEKTGILVDTSSLFNNPSRFEEGGVVRTITATNLTPNTRYYVKGYVIKDGITVYSSNTQDFLTNDSQTNYFGFSNSQNSDVAIELEKHGTPANITLEYTTNDGNTWTTWSSSDGSLLVTLHSGERVKFRGDNSTFCAGMANGFTFNASGSVTASGNIMSLVDRTARSTTIPNVGCFAGLFTGFSRLLINNLLFPATTLTNYCYYQMFSGCSSITSAPELPATVVPIRAYMSMFRGCTNLTTASVYADAISREGCYEMFRGCTSLQSISNFAPTGSIGNSGCQEMFKDCSSLITAPELLSTSIGGYTYMDMFNGCTSLQTTPSSLPATSVPDYAYSSMFYGCVNITTPPTIGATRFTGTGSCTNMFYNCRSLRTAPSLNATQLSDFCYQEMFENCRSLTAAPDLPATTIYTCSYRMMFKGCSSLTSAPRILPALLLKYMCYSEMFSGTAITTAPELPAGDLATQCYYRMFAGCINLNNIKVRATSWNTTDAQYFTAGVAETGDFYNLGNATIPTGNDGIPSNWTIHTSL